MRKKALTAAPFLILAVAIAGCSSSAASSAPVSQAPVSQAPVSQAPASQAPAVPSVAASGVTVDAKSVGTIGTVIVSGSNGMTVYTFANDVKDNGKSACSGGCATKWPPLTVAAGGTPTAGAGATGKLATITRDDGTLQVTYNGLPLYFFANDKAPGDANGVYTNWLAVKP